MKIEYIDEHMGVSWPWPELREGIAALAKREGLVDARGIPGLPDAGGDRKTDLPGDVALRISKAPPGTYVFVAHPGYDNPDMQAFRHEGLAEGQVARERVFERLAFTDPRVLEACRTYSVKPITYPEALSA